jgi:CHRD domain
MQRKSLAAMTAIVAVGGIVGVGTAAGGDGKKGDKQLFGALNGRNEIGPDGKKGAGDPDGTGGATGTIKDQPGANSDLCIGLTFKNLGTPTAAHIHRGRKNENGPVVVGFFGPPTATPPPPSGDPGSFADCVSISDTLAGELRRRPKSFYWNVHTNQFPNGAIRDQVFTGGDGDSD